MKTVKAIVSGKVQGVGYRYFAKTQADSLGVKGYAKNLANGQVELVMHGEDASVDSLVAMLRQGPRFALVDSVDFREIRTSEVFGGFGTG